MGIELTPIVTISVTTLGVGVVWGAAGYLIHKFVFKR